METFAKIPGIDMLLASKKAKFLTVLIALFIMRDQFGLGMEELKYISMAFMAYFIGQGIADVGAAIFGHAGEEEVAEEEAPADEA
jgi:hypothetical protein